MTKNICDRCKKEIVDANFLPRLQVRKIQEWYPLSRGGIFLRVDLCENCEKDLYRFIYGKEWEEGK